MFAVVTTVVGLLAGQRSERTAQQDVEQELTIGDDAEVVEVEVESSDDGPTVVTATVRSPRDLTDDELRTAERQLEQHLDTPVELRVVVLRVVTAPE